MDCCRSNHFCGVQAENALQLNEEHRAVLMAADLQTRSRWVAMDQVLSVLVGGFVGSFVMAEAAIDYVIALQAGHGCLLLANSIAVLRVDVFL
ncbi:hypothetical protein L6452_09223 [Arctium lappa]|uniref:Uncharacterized protein n=1 Tax=Arctium lappa TaxID=4217 RepID=A0ACB9DJE8_ARCLA|nr:hypothetical protein L6452_09223 [Arctium lappa]